MKFGITKRWILTLFVDQSMIFLGKTGVPIQMQIKKSIYIIKQLKTLPLILYHMRLSLMMIAIPHGPIVKLEFNQGKKYC